MVIRLLTTGYVLIIILILNFSAFMHVARLFQATMHAKYVQSILELNGISDLKSTRKTLKPCRQELSSSSTQLQSRKPWRRRRYGKRHLHIKTYPIVTLSACHTCSTLIFSHLTNQIPNLWRCRCRCCHRYESSLISHFRSWLAREWPWWHDKKKWKMRCWISKFVLLLSP